ncbi:MAG TPA: hypothetical protein VKV15_20610, partial [Bryobacteraceae bacterium]|nr:hypothetical protein [Bryobacteraceae bacterium]
MYQRLYLFTLIAFAWLIGVKDVAVGQTPNVWAWGDNYSGQLGNGEDVNTVSRSVPVQVNGMTGAVKVAAGSQNSLALKSDGTVWAWGSNDFGQLGNGINVNSSVPVQ